MMKKPLLAAASFAVFVLTGAANAADLAARFYVAPPSPPVWTWTGFYIGGNVGYSWGDARTDIAGNGTTVTFPGTLAAFTNPPAAFADSATQRLQGVIGGGQIGFNYQFSPQWVLGFEADIQASGERGSSKFLDPFSTTVCDVVLNTVPTTCGDVATVNGTAVTSLDAKIRWFGTVRGRIGALINDQTLVYGTGGLAYGGVSVSGNVSVNGSISGGACCTIPTAFAASGAFGESKTKVGFAVGGGIESKIAYWLPSNWTLRLEYLYLDLGSFDTTAPFPPAQPVGFASPFAGTFTTHTHFMDNIVRVGLNYQFH
jgi:outer membrane immunogenic protein